MNLLNFSSLNKGILPALRIGVTVGMVLAISLLFPKHTRFKYSYEQGQSWIYEELVAPFDFAIIKTPEELELDRKKVMESFSPFYRRDDSTQARSLRQYEKKFERYLKGLEAGQFRDLRRRPEVYRNYGSSVLSNLHNRGIIELTEEHRGKNSSFVISVLHRNTVNEQTLGTLYHQDEVPGLLSKALQQSNLPDAEFLLSVLSENAQANVHYEKTKSEESLAVLLRQLGEYKGKVRKGELIVPRFGNVDPAAFQKLESLRTHYEKEIAERSSWIYWGYVLLTGLIFVMLWFFLRRLRPLSFHKWRDFWFILTWFIIYAYLTHAVVKVEVISIYIIPFGIVPILLKTFFDKWLAFFVHLMIVLLATFLSSAGFEFAFIQILVGSVVLMTSADPRDWNRFFYTIVFMYLASALGYFSLALIQQGRLSGIDWWMFNWLFISSFLTMLANPMIPLLERIIGFTSPVALAELGDLNRPLLQQLALKAPGTLQHSLQVANLAEAAARAIDADALLLRVAALYHDIGKTVQPQYFIENQRGSNPHDELPPLDSARIIIGHVTEGVKLARQYRLPKMLIEFIETHHGTTRVEYFYQKHLKENPDVPSEVETEFRYPGPCPQSREESILMMADSIEAAAKATLKNPSSDEVAQLVNKIIEGKISRGQLEKSKLTLQELEQCKLVFVKTLSSMYHARIQYPDGQKEK
jgi:cyclic-di-AMP phosphodiesterase PgpH